MGDDASFPASASLDSDCHRRSCPPPEPSSLEARGLMSARSQPRATAVVALAIATLLLPFWARLAMSGGFTQLQGATFADLTFRTLESRSFRKLELEAYLEYGLLDSLTFTVKSPYDWLENEVNGKKLHNEGFIDQEIGLRWRLNRDPFLAVAVQGTLILPSGYNPKADLPLDKGVVGFEWRLPVSGSYQLGQQYGYWSAEAAYRDYFGPRSDEVRLFGELNVPVIDRLAVDVQIDHITSLQTRFLFRKEETDLTKLLGHVRVRLLDRLILGLGGYTHIRGVPGNGVEVQLWYTFGPWP